MSSEINHLLVIKAKSGDKEAFGDLYARYSREMYSFALWYLGDRYSAEDAVSDAVLNAFLSVKNVKKPEKFKSWLFTVLLRSCQKQLRYVIGMRKTVEIGEMNDESGEMSTEERAELNSALMKISGEDREILLLSALGNLTSTEIGEIKSMPPGTVRSKISRATDKLYAILGEGSLQNGE